MSETRASKVKDDIVGGGSGRKQIRPRSGGVAVSDGGDKPPYDGVDLSSQRSNDVFLLRQSGPA